MLPLTPLVPILPPPVCKVIVPAVKTSFKPELVILPVPVPDVGFTVVSIIEPPPVAVPAEIGPAILILPPLTKLIEYMPLVELTVDAVRFKVVEVG